MSLAELFFRPFLSREGGLSLSPSAPSLVAGHGKMLAQVGSMCGVSYNLSNWCWFSLITPKRRRYSMWKEGIGPSCTWQMVELFIANSYPVKLGFFLVENCSETDCGFSVCMIYSCADASMHELRDTRALCFAIIGSALFFLQDQMTESFANQKQ